MSWRLRARATLDAWFVPLVLVLAAAALAGAWGTYATHLDPGTTTEERVEAAWTIEGEFDHEATVTEPNPVYAEGTTLEDRRIYPARIAPALDGTFRFGCETGAEADLDVTIDTRMRYRAVEETGAGETVVVWERVESLGEPREYSVGPGEDVEADFAVNLSAVGDETDRIEEHVGQVPGEVQTAVLADVHVNGTVGGRQVDEWRTYELSLVEAGDAYRVEGAGERETFEATTTATVEESYSPVRTVGAPLVLASALVALGGLLLARRDGLALDERERERLAYRDDRAEFEEWIATARLPEGVDDRPRAEADSLADLVDLAVDTDDGAVVYDPDRDEYLLLHDDVAYAYVPPTSYDLPDEPSIEDSEWHPDGDAAGIANGGVASDAGGGGDETGAGGDARSGAEDRDATGGRSGAGPANERDGDGPADGGGDAGDPAVGS